MKTIFGNLCFAVLVWCAMTQAAPVSAAATDSIAPATQKTAAPALGDSSSRRVVRSDSSADTVSRASPSPIDSTKKKSAPMISAAVAKDTVRRFDLTPYWGFGAGWSLGSFPLYSTWQAGLPDSLGSFGITSRYPVLPFDPSAADSDTVTLTLRLREPPSSYHIYFPVTISVVPFTNRKHHAGFHTTAFYMGKSYIAAIAPDTSHRKIDLKESMRFGSAGLGMTYSLAIPAEYFSVSGVNMTYFDAGFTAYPLSVLDVSRSVHIPDTLGSLVSMLRDSIYAHRSPLRAFGAGLSWSIGFSSITAVTPISGIEVGIHYTGIWYGRFYSRGHRVTQGDLNQGSTHSDSWLGGIAHRMVLDFQFVKHPGKKASADEASAE